VPAPRGSDSGKTTALRLKRELADARRQLSEALERQRATAEILGVISSLPADVQPVFDTIVRNFAQLCGGVFGAIYTFDGELVHFAGAHGFTPQQREAVRARYPVRVEDRSVIASRAIRAKAPVHIQDVLADPDYDQAYSSVGSWRRMLAVPMLREGVPLGAIVASWAEAGATPKQHEELLKVFAAQAVIAIENVRLLNELRQRTADLSESLEQQTATSEVLRVISSSPADIQPVLDAVVASAAHLCGAMNARIRLREGDALVPRANFGPLIAAPAGEREPLNSHWVSGRAVLEGRTIHVPDLAASDEYPRGREMAIRYGHRATLAVPLLREGTAIGVILLRRREARPFTDKQIELVSNFAKQIVIAIENVRLLNELRQRTDDLSEALEQQTATSEVLQVISSSQGELGPVFQAILENAARLCEAKFGVLNIYENGAFRVAAMHNVPPAYAEAREREVLHHPIPQRPLARAVATKQLVHVTDYAEEPVYKERDPGAVDLVELGRVRSLVVLPMLKEQQVVGTIAIHPPRGSAIYR
jgi:GAF domain-containing protein